MDTAEGFGFDGTLKANSISLLTFITAIFF